MRGLEKLSSLSETLEFLLTSDNTESIAEAKYFVIEDIASMIISELMEQKLTAAICGDLEKHAYSINDQIADPNLRNQNIFSAV